MACPVCGGISRRELSPGYFECTTVISSVGPNPIHPALGPVTAAAVCGHRYPESTATSGSFGLCYVCNSLGAIGVCADCRRPVDGVHGIVGTAGLLCGDCLHTRRAAAEVERRERAEEEEAMRIAAESRLSTVEYLAQVAIGGSTCNRPARGSEIAAALASLNRSGASFDGNGGLALGQPELGVDKVLRADGALELVKRSGWLGKTRLIHIADHSYEPGEVEELLRCGCAYIDAISSDNF